MRENKVDQTTFIVHTGTGTIIDADDVLVMNMDTTGIMPSDFEIIAEAGYRGNTLYEMYVVLVGNVFDGMKVVGPFPNIDEANDWADRNAEMDWLTARINLPYLWDGTERVDWEG